MTDSRRPVPSKQTRPPVIAPPTSKAEEQWVGLREAEGLTGIPASTIRNWARKQRIESRFELDESGDRRYVEINEVVAWADHLGRQHKRVASRESRVASEETGGEASGDREATAANEHTKVTEAPAVESPRTRADTSRDASSLTRDEPPATRDPRQTPTESAPEVPEGTMLVPLDAWNKMLNQLGNLHEAGQQLADARERAAKAETEVQFLRERLAELREAATPNPPLETTEPHAPQVEETQEPLWVDLYRRWNRRRR